MRKSRSSFSGYKRRNSLLKEVSCRPDAMILGYPVITSGKYRNEDSFLALLGEILMKKSGNICRSKNM